MLWDRADPLSFCTCEDLRNSDVEQLSKNQSAMIFLMRDLGNCSQNELRLVTSGSIAHNF